MRGFLTFGNKSSKTPAAAAPPPPPPLPPPPLPTAAAAAAAAAVDPPPAPSFVLSGCKAEDWQEVEKAHFFVANPEARRGFVDTVDELITGGAPLEALPRGSEAAKRARRLVRELVAKCKQDFSDVAGAQKAGILANLVAALNGVACLKPRILDYGRAHQMSVYDVLDALDELKAANLEELRKAEALFHSTSLATIWADTIERDPKCVESAMLRLGVMNGAMCDEVLAMMLSSDEFMGVEAYKVPPPGVDPKHFMDLRALCCATSLHGAAPAAKKLNCTCGLFAAPKNEQLLSDTFRVRRQLHIRSLVLLQDVEAVFKLLGKSAGLGIDSLKMMGLKTAKHILKDEAYSYSGGGGPVFEALSTAMTRHNAAAAAAAHTEAAIAHMAADAAQSAAAAARAEAASAREGAEAAGDAARQTAQALVHTQQRLSRAEQQLQELAQEVTTLRKRKAREDEGADNEEPGAKRTPATASRFRGTQAALAAAALGRSSAPARSPLASFPVNIAAGVESHPLSGSAAGKLATPASQPSPAVAAVVAAARGQPAAAAGSAAAQADAGVSMVDNVMFEFY